MFSLYDQIFNTENVNEIKHFSVWMFLFKSMFDQFSL